MALIDDLPLFSAVAATPPIRSSALELALKNIQPDSISPKEALDLIYKLKAKTKV